MATGGEPVHRHVPLVHIRRMIRGVRRDTSAELAKLAEGRLYTLRFADRTRPACRTDSALHTPGRTASREAVLASATRWPPVAEINRLYMRVSC
jgi:hypothetical protein